MVCSEVSALVQNKDQELVADMSAGNDLCKLRARAATSSSIRNIKKHIRTNDPDTHSVGVVWYFKMFHFQSEISEATEIYASSSSYLKWLYEEKHESCYLCHYNIWEANGVNFPTLLYLLVLVWVLGGVGVAAAVAA